MYALVNHDYLLIYFNKNQLHLIIINNFFDFGCLFITFSLRFILN